MENAITESSIRTFCCQVKKIIPQLLGWAQHDITERMRRKKKRVGGRDEVQHCHRLSSPSASPSLHRWEGWECTKASQETKCKRLKIAQKNSDGCSKSEFKLLLRHRPVLPAI
ncbi:hypothetical protein KOW79_016988 [Hemibagrus wyckioides]|uniref:Uncharacterized protein n=1 Tax=Hemibagrus wyckioides TaxID=337641 RepID=A0A9D3NF30_9TELE|nr:hypothetical protein KOW79_016988 [Hemibagrus wyckioides]